MPLHLEPPKLAVGLRRQADVAHDGNVRGEDRFDRGENAPASLDLDRRAAGLRQEAARVRNRLGRVRLIRQERHVADYERAAGGCGDRGRVPDHGVHRRRERVRPAVDGHLDGVPHQENVQARGV